MMNHDQEYLDDLERLLLENLKIAKENREYLVKIDRRQRWERNWKAIYWAFILALAVFGTYYAFPYFKQIRDTVAPVFSQVSAFTGMSNASAQKP